MKKINFENLPSTNTPISAGNLNQMQSNIENEIDELHNTHTYSTAEQRIGTWIDGKLLYRKTIKREFVDEWTTIYLNDINADTIYINYGKTFANFKKDNVYYLNGQFYIDDTDFFRTFIANKNELLVAFAYTTTERSATITIEYTKTTD